MDSLLNGVHVILKSIGYIPNRVEVGSNRVDMQLRMVIIPDFTGVVEPI
ncbi:hypothetical protein [Brenneria roseae]|nr:hypothetical protein [Brenneria roseae]